jgi:hypothetical protein
VRSAAIELKRSLFDKELLYIYKDFMLEKAEISKGFQAG